LSRICRTQAWPLQFWVWESSSRGRLQGRPHPGISKHRYLDDEHGNERTDAATRQDLHGRDSSISAPFPKESEAGSVVYSQAQAGDAPWFSRNPQLAKTANADA
jgi:hypothetical protein